jgi:hypothetical protein
MKLLHDVAPADGNGNDSPAAENKPAPAPAAPPAATVVVNAPTERERELAAELERAKQEAADAKSDRLSHERTIMQLEDEHDRYRKSVEVKQKPAAKKSSLTFFD